MNPDLPPKTHIKTDTSVKGVKFGLDIETILDVAKGVVGHPGLAVVGLHMHLGSPILTAEPYRQGREKAVKLIERVPRAGARHPVSEHGRRLRHPLPQAGGAARERVRRGDPAGREGDRLPAGARTGPVHRRQRGDPRSAA